MTRHIFSTINSLVLSHSPAGCFVTAESVLGADREAGEALKTASPSIILEENKLLSSALTAGRLTRAFIFFGERKVKER